MKPQPIQPNETSTTAEDFDTSLSEWQTQYQAFLPDEPVRRNRSGIEVPGSAPPNQT